ncbi:O-antigen ligase family protein [Paucihalobacter ruber]|uniref:O-antigen ligase family protein n=1 Tax=Paucihalobacter ruber TaxID=2567861 RepID=A0A506PRW5_9FLAO|nr:O-antigen ligase family protein [Paucihalobacter ruber]TPV34960.1 O-antigen ligase family protein [Paucihalobacter ruber]
MFPFNIEKSDFKVLKSKAYIMLLVLIAYIGIRSCFVAENADDINFIKKILLALILPIVFLPVKDKSPIIKAFIFSVFFCVLISFFNLIVYISESKSFNFTNGDIINDVLIVERLYLGFLCCISFALSFVLYKESSQNLKSLLVFNIIICFSFLVIISARIGLISIVFISLYYFYSLFSIRKAIFATILLVTSIIVVFQFNHNLRNRVFYSNDIHENYFFKLKEWEPRIVIWECGYKIFNNMDNPFLGQGLYYTKNNLVKCYSYTIEKEDRKKFFLEKQYNTHNQFIDLTLNYGLLALFIFLAFLSALFYQAKNNFRLISLLFLLLFFGFVENFFHRQIGVYLFSLIIMFIINKKIALNLNE